MTAKADKTVTVLAQEDEDAERLASGVRGWWRRLSPKVRALIAVSPLLLTSGGFVYAAVNVSDEVAEHDERITDLERLQAVSAAVQVAERAADRIDAAESRLDKLEALLEPLQRDLGDIKKFMLYGVRPVPPEVKQTPQPQREGPL